MINDTFYVSTGAVQVDANAANSAYAVLGIRLKVTELNSVVNLERFSMISETSDNFEYFVLRNPVIAGVFAYVDAPGGKFQVAHGATANLVTGGTAIDGGYSRWVSPIDRALQETTEIGSNAGVSHELVLCVRPLGGSADIQGSLTIKEP
jgi:hypothetical protein